MTASTRREALVELAERIEAASGADVRDLLDQSFRLIHGEKPVRVAGGSDEWIAWLDRYNPFFRLLEAGAFLDAAMSLVPEGFMWRLQSWPDGVNSALLEKGAGDFGAIDARHTETFAATPALALTAACLRAIAATGAA